MDVTELTVYQLFQLLEQLWKAGEDTEEVEIELARRVIEE